MTLLPRAITVPEQNYLRSANQYTKVFATFHVPNVVYSARLAAVPSSTDGVLSVTYNSGTGTYTNVLNDMTMYVGTTARGGGADAGGRVEDREPAARGRTGPRRAPPADGRQGRHPHLAPGAGQGVTGQVRRREGQGVRGYRSGIAAALRALQA